MELYKKFQRLSRLSQIGLVVFSLHLLFIFFLLAQHLVTHTPPKRPIAIRTHRMPAPVALAPPQKAPPAPVSVPAAKKNKTAPAEKPKPAKKTSLSNPKPSPAVTATPPPSSPKPELSLPSLIVPQKIDVKPLYIEEGSLDFSYEEQLIALFQSELDLPEMGEVKARLEIDPQGRLVSCTLLDSKSRKNGEFLKNRLPDLLFPCFNGTDIQSFTVTFRNVENR